jgi:hypothetical protein
MIYRALEEGEIIKEGAVYFGTDNSEPIKVGGGAFEHKFDCNEFFPFFRPIKSPTLEEVRDSLHCPKVDTKYTYCKYTGEECNCEEHYYKATLKLMGIEVEE